MELLIVDDEETALQAVLKNVKWEELPFKRVYTATNITSAKAELENEKIRIVLCDIEMPMGSGLDLLEWMNQNRRDVLCIFMTCHAEFSYAQKAIDYGVYKYLTKPINTDELEQIITKIVSRLDEQQPEVEYSGIPDAVRELIETVEKNLSSDIKLNTIADQLHMDAIYLGRLFKKSMGIGFKDYVVQKRMERAQQLIRTTNLPISEIAEKVGYREENYFRMSFKRFCGCSPREYKRQIDK